MALGNVINHFLLSEWLWSMTHGSYHVAINIFVMLTLLIFVLKMRTVPAVFLTISAHIVAVGVFTAFVVGVLMYGLHITYNPETDHVYLIPNTFFSCVYLGLIYACLQSLFFAVVNIWYALRMHSMITIAFLSNSITAWIMSSLL